jgi:acetylornithine aminotransferase
MTHVLRCSGYEVVKTSIVRAAGAYLYDDRGNRYVDLEAGVWCAALGHSHPRVVRVLRDQGARISHLAYRYTHPVTEEAAAARLATLNMPDGRCIFLSSGSEAVEFGVRVASRRTARPHTLTLATNFVRSLKHIL